MTEQTNQPTSKYFFRTFGYIKPYSVLYSIGMFFYASQSFFFPLIIGLLYGGVMDGIIEGDFSSVVGAILRTVAFMGAFMLVVGVGIYFYMMSSTYALRDIRLDIFRAYMKTGSENELHTGEGIALVNTDASTASDIFMDALYMFLTHLIGIVFSAVTIFIIDWRLGIGAVVMGAVIFFAQARFAKPLAKLGKQRLEANADATKAMSNILAGALTIRAFGRHQQSLLQFDHENGKLKKIALSQAIIGMWQNLFTTIQGWLTLILVFVLGGWLVASGLVTLPQLITTLTIAGALGTSASAIGAAYAGLQTPIVAARRVFAAIDAVQDLDVQKSIVAEKNMKNGSEINLTNLNFAYKNADKNTLDDITLSIEENKMIAFVGESGSGKSTLLRLIIGMYERDNLSMYLGGSKFEANNLGEWRKHFAYVDQSCKLFDMSIAKNIAMGNGGSATDDEIIDAAKRAFAHDFISELGYDADCGEKGDNLSGGQRQRIAIARALCKKAKILVFDEATAALDMESERNIMQTIEALRTDHTILITTHNLSNIKTADQIVVMDSGKIAESGTHEELLARDGLYKRLLEQSSARGEV